MTTRRASARVRNQRSRGLACLTPMRPGAPSACVRIPFDSVCMIHAIQPARRPVHVSVDHEIVFSLQLLMRDGGRLLYTFLFCFLSFKNTITFLYLVRC